MKHYSNNHLFHEDIYAFFFCLIFMTKFYEALFIHFPFTFMSTFYKAPIEFLSFHAVIIFSQVHVGILRSYIYVSLYFMALSLFSLSIVLTLWSFNCRPSFPGRHSYLEDSHASLISRCGNEIFWHSIPIPNIPLKNCRFQFLPF